MAQGSVERALHNGLYSKLVDQTSSLSAFCFHCLFSFHLLLLHTHVFFIFFNTQAQTGAKTKQRCIKVHTRFIQMRSRFTQFIGSSIIFFSSSPVYAAFLPTLGALPPDPQAQPVVDYQHKMPGRTHERHTL